MGRKAKRQKTRKSLGYIIKISKERTGKTKERGGSRESWVLEIYIVSKKYTQHQKPDIGHVRCLDQTDLVGDSRRDVRKLENHVPQVDFRGGYMVSANEG